MKRKIRIILFIICICVLVGGGVFLFLEQRQSEDTEDQYNQIRHEVKEEEVTEPVEDKEPEKIPINFKKLKKQNKDVYAWIHIEGTRVDYPILQHPTDDSYYLNRTIDHKAGYPGSIYTEKSNAKDFTDFNTVIYGHDMLNGTMFKDLHKFEKKSFFKKHDTVDIYTETEHKVYKIFAAVVFSDQHLMYSYDYDVKSERNAFLQAVYGSNNMKNQYRDSVKVDEDSHIITLSTCIGDQPTKRWLVLAVEMDE